MMVLIAGLANMVFRFDPTLIIEGTFYDSSLVIGRNKNQDNAKF